MRKISVGRRALKVAAAVAAIIIALSASIFYLLEGRRASKAVDEEVARLVDSQSPSIVEALWDYDGELLHALADGLRMYPYINYIRIAGSGGMKAEDGARKAGSVELDVPLFKRGRGGEDIRLGELVVEIDRGRIGAELLRTVLPSLAILLLSMAAMSLAFLLLFSRSATRHLTGIARYLEKFDPGAGQAPLALDKKRRGDEFDLLADAFNALASNLRSGWDAELESMGELVRSLREKDVLLQEVYHRTRNNMQLISAFLGMDAGPEPEAGMRRLVARMDSRIASMALVHKMLYESKDLSRIDLGEYLEELAREIGASSLAGRPEVAIGVDAERGVVALIDAAVPCGLAINELVANAVEHAFPEGRGGRILVELERSEAGVLRLAVSDDGVGLPEGFDLARDGRTGLRIVALLAESQLRGRLERVPAKGTRFELAFRDDFLESRV